MEKYQDWLAALRRAVADDTFVKASLANHRGAMPGLKKVLVKAVTLKRGPQLSFTYRYTTRDEVKNYAPQAGIELLASWLPDDFYIATLLTRKFDYQWSRVSTTKQLLRRTAASVQGPVQRTHDRQKSRPFKPSTPQYLARLGLAGKEGKVFKNAVDKYRQLEHFIELLQPHLRRLPADRPTRIYDMGAGKGYLTFALYDHLTTALKKPARVTGIELRDQLVDTANAAARAVHFTGLDFQTGRIDTAGVADADVVIALHACDTATDDALARGIKAGAQLIVAAPCCHKQIRRELERGGATSAMRPLLQYGIFLERQAEMLTDTLRALLLNYHGYRTKAVQFVGDQHTPKNVLLIAERQPKMLLHDPAVRAKIDALKALFGIQTHYLETVL